MTILLVVLILAAVYAVARAITLAHRAGYRGFWAFCVWALLVVSRESFSLAEGIREGQRHRAAQRLEWNQRNGFGEVECG